MAYDPRQWYSYSNLYEQGKNNAPDFDDTNQEKVSNINDLTRFYDLPLNSNPPMSNNMYLLDINDSTSNSNEYDPCSPAINKRSQSIESNFEKPDPRKLDQYITALQKSICHLSSEYKKKLPYDIICQLAHAVLDGTVFDITKGLQDIQKINEKNLSEKRTHLMQCHREQTLEIAKRHKTEISNSQARPHQILVLQKQHKQEILNLQLQHENDLSTLDQKIILELDQLMSDQQATLQRAGLPLFHITNKPEDIRLQMFILKFILKLSAR